MKQIKILNKTIQLTPTRVFIAATLSLLTFSVILRLLTPNVPDIPNVENIPKINGENEFRELETGVEITVSAKIPEIPKEMTVYQTTTSIDLPVLAQTMAQNLGLTKVPDRNFSWRNTETPSSLVYSQYLNQIEYSKTVEKSQDPLNRDKAVETAVGFVRSNLQIANLKPDLSSVTISNYGDEDHYEYSNLPSGSLHVIPFVQSIGNYNLATNNTSFKAVRVWVGPGHQVVKASINTVIPEYSELKLVKSFSETEIITAVKAGQGSIILIDDDNPGLPDINNITAIDLKDAVIEYRSYGSTGVIYPYLKFSGKALIQGGGAASVEIIYPIVRTITD